MATVYTETQKRSKIECEQMWFSFKLSTRMKEGHLKNLYENSSLMYGVCPLLSRTRMTKEK